ncbi:family 16 glycosylhydrolase [Hymenobacter sp. HMF4947]|uniref:Family 16 glycosylhydrolase n=1 Tax=Hymenobacter ginkgonis TaxID=2682976 RepID=A0A7K1T9M4_9BACT|nr:glycoside hydrolase family 16 protein [Hymenobacter ginkgonis]MVN75098.1 family 16 glycosylhydrolase [Hymenobacter ginkgonis]
MLPLSFSLPPRARLGTSFLLALALSSCTENKTPDIPAPTPNPVSTAPNAEVRDFAQYTELMWSDEFNGAGPADATKWAYDTGNNNGWGNQELETYTTSTDNVSQNGGNLVIQAMRQAGSTGYTSGRILTKGKQSFQYGRIDVRAKLPQGQGIWPAIWMLGSDIDQNNWPKCGEIDIMELRGQEPTKILSTMHYGTTTADHQYKGIDNVKLPGNASYAADFHVYSIVRAKDQMQFFVDGAKYYTFTSSDASPYPFNNPFFMVLNVAVGGNFLGNPDASTVFPQQMQVDYVRYYQYK